MHRTYYVVPWQFHSYSIFNIKFFLNALDVLGSSFGSSFTFECIGHNFLPFWQFIILIECIGRNILSLVPRITEFGLLLYILPMQVIGECIGHNWLSFGSSTDREIK